MRFCVRYRSQTPSRRAIRRQRCGTSSVWAMPWCCVPLSSSWGACFSWPRPCSSWMTERRLRNSEWLKHCWNNTSLFHLLFSNLNLKFSWGELLWINILDIFGKVVSTKVKTKFQAAKKCSWADSNGSNPPSVTFLYYIHIFCHIFISQTAAQPS